ncbi:hypothetical protein ABZ914_00860 [Spirillospora sp. NPDC046719]
MKDRIYLAEVLEDAIEHIESTTKPEAAKDAHHDPARAPAPIAWFARPGQDADVRRMQPERALPRRGGVRLVGVREHDRGVQI